MLFVPIGKAEPSTSPQSSAANLNGRTVVGTLGPATPPEVSHLSAEGGGDYCLPYSAASAAAHLGYVVRYEAHAMPSTTYDAYAHL